jgi:hypothetical protein
MLFAPTCKVGGVTVRVEKNCYMTCSDVILDIFRL